MINVKPVHDKFCSCPLDPKCHILRKVNESNKLVATIVEHFMTTPEKRLEVLPPEYIEPIRKLTTRLHRNLVEKFRERQERPKRKVMKKAHPVYCFWCRTVWNHVRICKFCESRIYLCDNHLVLPYCCV